MSDVVAHMNNKHRVNIEIIWSRKIEDEKFTKTPLYTTGFGLRPLFYYFTEQNNDTTFIGLQCPNDTAFEIDFVNGSILPDLVPK